MLRISKLTDYGIMLLTYMARGPALLTYSAPELAARSNLPLPTVSKLLKTLARRGVLIAQRGAKGGFSLARRPEDISVAEIIQALEGPQECVAQICDRQGGSRRRSKALAGIGRLTGRYRRLVLPSAVELDRRFCLLGERGRQGCRRNEEQGKEPNPYIPRKAT